MNIRHQFAKYAVVGVVSNSVFYLLYLLLTSAGMGHKTAMTLLYAVGVSLTFLLNRNWSFRHDRLFVLVWQCFRLHNATTNQWRGNWLRSGMKIPFNKPLVGMAPDFSDRVLAKRVWQSLLRWHQEEGLHVISTGISSRNSRVLNFYAAHGFRFPAPKTTFHWIPSGVSLE